MKVASAKLALFVATYWIGVRRVSHQKFGGARRDRTDDILLAKQALSQLSYGPITETCQLRTGGPG